MKSVLLLLAFLCTAASRGPGSGRVSLSPLSKTAYLQAAKRQIVARPRFTFPLRKKNGRLVIPTAKGPKVFTDVVIAAAAIKNGRSEEELITYTYLGYVTELKIHLIQVKYYETTKWVLIDAQGRQTELWGNPVFSPDMQHMVAICQGIEYSGGQPNIIQLVRVQNGVLRQVWSLEPKTWEPTAVSWVSPNSFLLTKELWNEQSQGTAYTYTKAAIQQ